MSGGPLVGLARLEGFYWVARTGGYARAARAFPYPITQPAVHQQVKKLEGELGTALFERVGKERLLLTPAGERLFRFVRPFFDQLPALVRSIQGGEPEGELKVGAAGLPLRTLLPAWVQRIQRGRPSLRVHLEEVGAQSGVPALHRGDLDLLIDYLPEVPESLAGLEVARLRPFLVLPKKHPLAGRKRLSLSALADETFISYSPGSLRELQMRALRAHAIEPPNTLTASSADVILAFVRAGLGFSLLAWLEEGFPRSRDIEVRPLSRPRAAFPVWALWRKETPENPLLDLALETAPAP